MSTSIFLGKPSTALPQFTLRASGFIGFSYSAWVRHYYRSLGNPKASMMEDIYPAWMMVSSQTRRWSSLTSTNTLVILQEPPPPGLGQLKQICIRMTGRRSYIPRVQRTSLTPLSGRECQQSTELVKMDS